MGDVSATPSGRRPHVTYNAPVASIDLAAFDEDGTPFEIWPCHECLPWHAEVVLDDDYVMVREWHAYECPTYQKLLKEADEAAGGE